MCQEYDLVDELTLLRLLVSRLRRTLRDVDPYVVGVEARERINRALEDDGGLGYEIH